MKPEQTQLILPRAKMWKQKVGAMKRSEDDMTCHVPGCSCGNLSASQLELVKLDRAKFRSLCETEIWFECANHWGSKLELDVVEGSAGLQDREIAAFLLSKLSKVELLMMEWTEDMLAPIIGLTKIVLDPEYDFFRALGPLHQGTPVPNCPHKLRVLHLYRDDEKVDEQDKGFQLAEVASLLLLPSLDELCLRNCLDDDLSDTRFEIEPGSSNISSLRVIKSMIGTRNWNILAAGCRRLKNVRYSVRVYYDRLDPEHEIVDTVSLTELTSSLQPHASFLETLELDFGALDPRSYNNKQLGSELQSFTKLTRFGVNQGLLDYEQLMDLQALPPFIQYFSLNDIYKDPGVIYKCSFTRCDRWERSLLFAKSSCLLSTSEWTMSSQKCMGSLSLRALL